MGVVNTNSISDPINIGSLTVSIAIDKAAGNDRVVVVAVLISDTNPAVNSLSFDPSGIDAAMTQLFTPVSHSTVTNNIVSLWYILDADLPSGTGTFDIELTHALTLNGLGLCVYYLEDVAQSVPSSNTGESNATDTPSISPSANATDTVIDFWMSDANPGGYTADSGQTGIFDELVSSSGSFSSYRPGSGDMGWTKDVTADQDHIGGYVIFEATITAAGGFLNRNLFWDNY